MTYRAVVEMAGNMSLRDRLVAAATEQKVANNPAQWVDDNLWHLVSSPGWATDWQYARDTATVNVNPDTGARDDVLSDAELRAAVAARAQELTPAQPAAAAAPDEGQDTSAQPRASGNTEGAAATPDAQ